MVCDRCRGKGLVSAWLPPGGKADLYPCWCETPCPECNGTGQGSCCQGTEPYLPMDVDG